MELGKQIAKARRDLFLTQKDLSDKLGITVTQISNIERGLSNPRIETLQNIAKELGVCFSVG